MKTSPIDPNRAQSVTDAGRIEKKEVKQKLQTPIDATTSKITAVKQEIFAQQGANAQSEPVDKQHNLSAGMPADLVSTVKKMPHPPESASSNWASGKTHDRGFLGIHRSSDSLMKRLNAFRSEYMSFIEDYKQQPSTEIIKNLKSLTNELLINHTYYILTKYGNELIGLMNYHISILDPKDQDSLIKLKEIKQKLSDVKTSIYEKISKKIPQAIENPIFETKEVKAAKTGPSKDALGIGLKSLKELYESEKSFKNKMHEASYRLSILQDMTKTIINKYEDNSFTDCLEVFTQAGAIYEQLEESSSGLLDYFQFVSIGVMQENDLRNNPEDQYVDVQSVNDLFSSETFQIHIDLLSRVTVLIEFLRETTKKFEENKDLFEFEYVSLGEKKKVTETAYNYFQRRLAAELPNRTVQYENMDIFSEGFQRAPRYLILLQAAMDEAKKQGNSNEVAVLNEHLNKINKNLERMSENLKNI